MAITRLNSASSLFEGSASAEVVQILTGGATRSTVKAAAGNDTITLLSSRAETALYVDANAGADFLAFSGNTTLASTTLIGGAGGDTIRIDGNFTVGEIKAGDGNDILDASDLAGNANLGGFGNISGTSINMGAGSDTLAISGTVGFTGVSMAMGAGADTVDLIGQGNFSATTILGGGGNDDVLVSGSVLGDNLINLDSSVNGGGADTIRIQNAVDIVGVQSSTIKGKGGQGKSLFLVNLAHPLALKAMVLT